MLLCIIAICIVYCGWSWLSISSDLIMSHFQIILACRVILHETRGRGAVKLVRRRDQFRKLCGRRRWCRRLLPKLCYWRRCCSCCLHAGCHSIAREMVLIVLLRGLIRWATLMIFEYLACRVAAGWVKRSFWLTCFSDYRWGRGRCRCGCRGHNPSCCGSCRLVVIRIDQTMGKVLMVLMNDRRDRSGQICCCIVVSILVYDGLRSWPDILDDWRSRACHWSVRVKSYRIWRLVNFRGAACNHLLSR